ncbi:conserved hypothetical protein [Methylobacterium sp. 4-46]|uniref:hypothetical protein n=1 Tax=unclassified Methylobacterium TaxID=2615210 RepID=UPI000165CA3D|nr:MULTISPECIES: hypothetical protein [Methylobacterium]ACA15130.1 conserved hypothetical protein [Methylobacterium sp. 4-46]WFT80863.1 hypothetical protein QA634_02880 [Methylobacterium nodulans]
MRATSALVSIALAGAAIGAWAATRSPQVPPPPPAVAASAVPWVTPPTRDPVADEAGDAPARPAPPDAVAPSVAATGSLAAARPRAPAEGAARPRAARGTRVHQLAARRATVPRRAVPVAHAALPGRARAVAEPAEAERAEIPAGPEAEPIQFGLASR